MPARRLGIAASLGLTALFYLAAAPAYPGLEVASDFLVSAGQLRPGNYGAGTVSAILGRLTMLWPVGPMSFRLNALTAMAIACSLAGAVHISLRLQARLGAHPGYGLPLAVGLACLCGGSPLLAGAAASGTGGAIALACAMWCLDALVAVMDSLTGGRDASAGPDAGDASPAARAAFAASLLLGLHLAEVHALGAPLLLVCLGSWARRRALRRPVPPSMTSLIGLLAGACAVLVVFRAGGFTLPTAATVDPTVATPALATIALAVAGIAGSVPLLRGPAGPLAAPVVALGALSGVLSLLAGPDTAVGQLHAPLALLCALVPASTLPLLLLPRAPSDETHRARMPALVPSLLAVAALALGYLQLHQASLRGRARLSPFVDNLCGPGLDHLPTRSVALTGGQRTGELLAACALEGQARPDVLQLRLDALSPSAIDAAVAREQTMVAAVRDRLLLGHVTTAALQAVAVRRPLFIELRTPLVETIADTLKPALPLFAVLPGGLATSDERGGARTQRARYAAMTRGTQEASFTAAQRDFLLEHYRVDAAYYDAHGDVECAAAAEARADTLGTSRPDMM